MAFGEEELRTVVPTMTKESAIRKTFLNSVRNHRFPLLAFFAFFAITSVHIYVKAHGPLYAGILLAIDHLFDIAITLFLFVLCAGMGRLLLSVIDLRSLTALEELAVGVALGGGIIGIATLVLGVVWSFNGVTITFLLALSATLARKQLLTLPDVSKAALAD
jgi:hypothetical protein